MIKKSMYAKALSLGGAALFCFSGCEPIPGKPLTNAQKRVDMEWLFNQFDANYAPLEYKSARYSLDYEDLKKSFLDKAQATQTNDEFFLVMHEFVAHFRDAHTSASLHYGNLPKRAQIAYLGFNGKRKGESLVVTEILPTYDLAHSGYPIQKGDEIIAINGKSLPEYIFENLVTYEDLGHEQANLTVHMNRIFNRVSTSDPIPTEKSVKLTIARRVVSPVERVALEDRLGVKLPSGIKKEVEMEVTLPWVVRDLYDFKVDLKLAAASAAGRAALPVGGGSLLASVGGEVGAMASSASGAELGLGGGLFNGLFRAGLGVGSTPSASLAPLAGFGGGELDRSEAIVQISTVSAPGLTQYFGLQSFDGSIQTVSSALKSFQGQWKGFGYLNTFYFPNQVESWTTDIPVDATGAPLSAALTPMGLLKKTRYIPASAYFVTPMDATYPTYITEEALHDRAGDIRHGKKLIATMYLNTFSPSKNEEKVLAEFNKTLETLQFLGVNDLVIDLVNNGGGSLSLGMMLAQALSQEKVVMPEIQLRLNQNWLDEFEELSVHAATDSEKVLAQGVLDQLRVDVEAGKRLSSPLSTEALVPFRLQPNENLRKNFKVVLMVNEMCASMCDIFSAILQDNRMARIIGSRTMGAGGNVVSYRSAPNSHLVIRQTESLLVRSNPSRSLIENVGVKPDVEVDTSQWVETKYRELREEAIDILTLVKGSKAHDSAEEAGAQKSKRMKKAGR
jgi:C-terminal processing protease CtpA/Prc